MNSSPAFSESFYERLSARFTPHWFIKTVCKYLAAVGLAAAVFFIIAVPPLLWLDIAALLFGLTLSVSAVLMFTRRLTFYPELYLNLYYRMTRSADRVAQFQTFGRELRALRQVRRLTQYDLAQAADMSVSGISNLELGKIQPSKDMLVRIATALKLNDEELARLGYFAEQKHR